MKKLIWIEVLNSAWITRIFDCQFIGKCEESLGDHRCKRHSIGHANRIFDDGIELWIIIIILIIKKKVEGFVLRRKEKDVPPLKTKWTSRLIRSWSFFFECSHRRTLVPSSVSPSQIWQAVAMATLVLCFQATYSRLASPPPSWLFLFETLDIFLELTGALKRQQLAVSTYALGNWTPETSHSIKYRFRVLHRLTHLSIDWIRPKYE